MSFLPSSSRSANRFRRPVATPLSMLGAFLLALSVLSACTSGVAGDVADDVEAGVAEAGDQAQEAIEDATGATDEIDEQSAELAATLRANGMSSLASAVEQIDASDLVGDAEYTFFGPNDQAFLDLGADELADLLADPADLVAVLRNHVVTERLDAATLATMTEVPTAAGTSLPISVDGDVVTVGSATVVAADIDAGNGVIHSIDQVILP